MIINLSKLFCGGSGSGSVDLSDYYNKQETDNKISDAISSQEFKTINGEEITGDGNIEIQGGGSTITSSNGILTDGTYDWYDKEYIDELTFQNGNIPKSEIWYKTNNGQVATGVPSTGYNVNLVSNTYENGIGKIKFGGTLTTIPDGFLDKCSSLISIVLPDNLTTVGEDFLDYCESLTSVKLPDSLTTVGDGFLYNCNKLTSVKLPDSLTTTAGWFLNFCTSLTSVKLPYNLKTVGQEFLSLSQSVTSVTIGDKIESFDKTNFLNGNFNNGVLHYPAWKKDDPVYQAIIAEKPSTWIAEPYGPESGSGGASLEESNGVITDGTLNWYNKAKLDKALITSKPSWSYAYDNNNVYYDTLIISNERVDGTSGGGGSITLKKVNGETLKGPGNIDLGLDKLQEKISVEDNKLVSIQGKTAYRDATYKRTVTNWSVDVYESQWDNDPHKINKDSVIDYADNWWGIMDDIDNIGGTKAIQVTLEDNTRHRLVYSYLTNGTDIYKFNGYGRIYDDINRVTYGTFEKYEGNVPSNKEEFEYQFGEDFVIFFENDIPKYWYEGSKSNYVVTPESIKTVAEFKTINGENVIGEGNIEIQGGGTTITETDGILSDGTYQWYDKSKCDLEIAESIEGMQEYVDEQIGNIEELLSRI